MTDADIQARLSRLKEQVKGILTEIEDIEKGISFNPWIKSDLAFVPLQLPTRTYENSVSGEPLFIDVKEYPFPRPSFQRMSLQMEIDEGIDHGMKNPPGVHGYKKPEPGEYVEGPKSTWVSTMKIGREATQGAKQ